MAKKQDTKAGAVTTDASAEPVAPKAPTSPLAGNINPSAGKSIDDRMADLLADHKRMGAR